MDDDDRSKPRCIALRRWQDEALVAMAAESGCSVSSLIREALAPLLRQNPTTDRQEAPHE